MTSPLINGSPRGREWLCLCPDGSSIRAETLRRCPRCCAERPDTAAIVAMEAESRRVFKALEELDRLSLRFGRFQAMQQVLREFGEAGNE